MSKQIKNKTANFIKIDDERFEIEITETIEETKTETFSIAELRSDIASKQKAIEANNNSLIQKQNDVLRSNEIIQAQIDALTALVDEAKSQGINDPTEAPE